MRMIGIASGLALLLAGSAPGLAAPGKSGSGYDPARIVCKSRGVVGSRLKRVRECHTMLEWEEMQRAERLGLARKQVNGDPGCSGGNGASCNPVATGGRDTPW
jgi:hypothetical protein